MDELKDVKKDIKEISETLLRNTVALEAHMLRTQLAEKRLDHVENFNRWFLGLFVSALMSIAAKLLLK